MKVVSRLIIMIAFWVNGNHAEVMLILLFCLFVLCIDLFRNQSLNTLYSLAKVGKGLSPCWSPSS